MDRDFLIDLFSDFGPVTIRRMFSGFGISADGTNFALALRGGLYLRADAQTIARFEAEGSKPFNIRPEPRPSPSAPTGNCRSGCTTIRRN
jgi:DNA transformation protein